MNIDIPLTELQKRSLFLATPMYGGQCYGSFMESVLGLQALCIKNGIQLKTYFMFNESLITRARTYAADEFMRSGCTHMMFIDADIGFNPEDVLALLAMQGPDTEYDIIGAAYPKKCVSWEKIKSAVDQGKADQDPNALEHYVGDFVLNAKESGNYSLKEPIQVAELGTGFMMIRRETFEKIQADNPDLMYRPDHPRTEFFDGSREICLFFDCVIQPGSKRYLSEDYYFCWMAEKSGMKIWTCPWMYLRHTGSYIFSGSVAGMLQLGQSMTYDPNTKKK